MIFWLENVGNCLRCTTYYHSIAPARSAWRSTTGSPLAQDIFIHGIQLNLHLPSVLWTTGIRLQGNEIYLVLVSYCWKVSFCISSVLACRLRSQYPIDDVSTYLRSGLYQSRYVSWQFLSISYVSWHSLVLASSAAQFCALTLWREVNVGVRALNGYNATPWSYGTWQTCTWKQTCSANDLVPGMPSQKTKVWPCRTKVLPGWHPI